MKILNLVSTTSDNATDDKKPLQNVYEDKPKPKAKVPKVRKGVYGGIGLNINQGTDTGGVSDADGGDGGGDGGGGGE